MGRWVRQPIYVVNKGFGGAGGRGGVILGPDGKPIKGGGVPRGTSGAAAAAGRGGKLANLTKLGGRIAKIPGVSLAGKAVSRAPVLALVVAGAQFAGTASKGDARETAGGAGRLVGSVGGSLLAGVATGAVTGLVAGSVVPGPGTLVGGIVGGLVGLATAIAAFEGGGFLGEQAGKGAFDIATGGQQNVGDQVATAIAKERRNETLDVTIQVDGGNLATVRTDSDRNVNVVNRGTMMNPL